MMADGPSSGKYDGFALSLTVGSPAEAEKLFAALMEGGKVDMPMGKTFFSPAFGMVTDKFGIKWMVYVEQMH
jgi:PhnB protein